MITRLDKQCRARILGAYNGRVLIDASWQATKADARRFFVNADGIAHNVVEVSREYFENKYGTVVP